MRYYELTCIGDPNLLQEKIISLIQGEKGILLDSSKKSNMVFFNFQMEPENLVNFEKKLKEDKEILRYMILAKKPLKTAELIKRGSGTEKPKQKVELKEIEKKLEEILNTD